MHNYIIYHISIFVSKLKNILNLFQFSLFHHTLALWP